MVGTRRLRTQSGSSGVVRQMPSNETRSRQVLTPEALAVMNKEQLRAECRRRGQRCTGNKAELLARLGYFKLAAAAGTPEQQATPLRNGLPTTPTTPSTGGTVPRHNRNKSSGSNMEVESLVLWRRPLTTVEYFCRETLILGSAAMQRMLTYKVLALTAISLVAAVISSYFVTGPHQPYVHILVREACWCGWWVILGVCSSVGLGTGLHTFLLYLGPHIARVTLAAYECGSVNFPQPPYPDDIICPTEIDAKYAVSIWNIMTKVRVESMMWGVGTALGELPPYFMARAARLSGRDAQTLSQLKDDENSFTSRAKLAIQRLVQRVGFIGILACASVPNPLFDLAGLTCGHFLVPFWTFFGATLIGKAIVKMHIQKLFVIIAFNETLLEQALAWVERVPYIGPKLEAPLLEFLRNQKARLHKNDSSTPPPENKGSVLSALLEKFVLAMVVYFIVSIVNTLAQNYAKRLGKGKKAKKKE